jgi:nicotinamidase/pyrazinamidase
VQRDFLPGGALAVPRGDEVIPTLNAYLHWFASRSRPVFVTRDWHPPNHCSFVDHGGSWPPHCVRDTPGAAFDPRLQLPPGAYVISKATEPDREAYSDFEADGFEQQLRSLGIKRLLIGGLATEYCVLATVRDALARGFKVTLLSDAIRAIDPLDGQRALAEMLRLGAVEVNLVAHEKQP